MKNNETYLIVAKWRHMASYNLVTIESGNFFLSEGTTLLPEPTLAY